MRLKLLSLLVPFFFLAAMCKAQNNFNVQFRSSLAYASNVDLSNIWGYVDSLGNEYALVGTQTGLSIVDVTNPNNPVVKFFVPGDNSFWREVQVWGKYAYVTTEACCKGLQIINLSNLPASVSSKYWTGSGAAAGLITRIHTVHIRDGFAYLNGTPAFGGAALIVSLADPWNPVYLSNTQLAFSGNFRYVHDCFVRNDTLWGAHIYGGFYSVINVANKSAPALIATQNTPGNFTHNTWLSDNGTRVLFTTDEVSNSFLTSYNVSNTGNMIELDRLQNVAGSGSIVHNTYIRNSYAINSYYKDGITIVDAARPDNLITVGRYDTYPQGSGNGFNGAWGVYPYLPSGNILVSDIDNGLFVLTPNYVRACYLEGVVRDSCTGIVLPGVSIVVQGGTHYAENSKITGIYKTGTAASGIYTVTFSKAGYQTRTINNVVLQNGVLTTLDVQLQRDNAPSVTGISSSSPSCFGGANGSIGLTVSNGTLPLSYLWSNGSTSSSLLGIVAGNYTCTVTDAIGCKTMQIVSLSQPSPLTSMPGITSVSCNGAADGIIQVTLNGGTSPYSASIQMQSLANRQATTANTFQGVQSGFQVVSPSFIFDSLAAGMYQVLVNDQAGCTSVFNYQLQEPPNPCQINLSIRAFIEGLYSGGGVQQSVLGNGKADTLELQLRGPQAPYPVLFTSKAIVDTAGWVSFICPSSFWQQNCYIVIRHRNSLETWSKQAVSFPSGIQLLNLTTATVPFGPRPAVEAQGLSSPGN
jgi:choice-of-anchor B domain-containing protein